MRIGIVGCSGRMGQMLVAAIRNHPLAVLSGGTEQPGSPFIGQSLADDLVISDDPAELFVLSDAVIDFSSPAATRRHADLAAQTKTALVVGTTGLTVEDEAVLKAAAQHIPVIYAPNYSVGVTLLSKLVETAATVLADDYDIDILEMHHHHKVDSPSGTALGLGRAAARGRKVALDQVWCKSRDGLIGARPKGEIGFATLRGGDVVGDHTVIFAGDGERLELTHKASNRAVFANGAVRAALWTGGQNPGLYTMFDVLGI